MSGKGTGVIGSGSIIIRLKEAYGKEQGTRRYVQLSCRPARTGQAGLVNETKQEVEKQPSDQGAIRRSFWWTNEPEVIQCHCDA